MKNKTVQLVNEWATFEESYPEGSIADFCRYYLAQQDEKNIDRNLAGGGVPHFAEGLLMKIIGRISRLNMLYANLALRDTELNQIEEFGMLYTVKQEKNPKKSEVIHANLFEVSSGTDILNRMKQRGLIKEVADKDDKRSKRIMLTEKGEQTIDTCYVKIRQNAEMMTGDLTEDEKRLTIHLLNTIELKFSSLWPKHRGLSFEEIYRDVTGGN